ncbi:hypothetical protein [Arthrobacter sp. JSM 101049]|uniref:hypothetical protein n=1 Tax=Arthrobacter sp. JSM 101049 TaxID=929097 RepID=UPI003562A091
MRIFTFLAGAAVGYVLGARAGRDKYDQLRDKAQELWTDPHTQEKLNDVGSALKDKAPDVGAAAASAAGTVAGKVKDTAASATHRATGSSDSADDSTDGKASSTLKYTPDHTSDPALGSAARPQDGGPDGTEWAAEGGATPSGPATGN